MSGAALVGARYEPPYPNVEDAHRVVAADLRLDGRRHAASCISPRLSVPRTSPSGLAQGWPVHKPVGDDGRFTDLAPAFVRGHFVKDADPRIVDDLRERGVLLRSGTYEHSLPVLLAMRHAAALLRAHVLVRAHDPGEGPSARGERAGALVPRPHQARPVRELAGEQRGLGAVHASATGARRCRSGGARRAPAGRRLAHRARRARGPRRPRRRPPPASDRRRDVHLSRVRPTRLAAFPR